MKLRPVSTNVLVKVIPEPEGAITLLTKESPQKGIIMAVGSKAEELPIGAEVSFARYVGTEVELEGELHLLIPKENVLTYE